MSSTQQSADPSKDQKRLLRDVLGLFPTGVAIVTSVAADGERLGATVSSFNTVSLDPPLVLFSMARNARSFGAWSAAQHFAVNILHEDQSSVSTRFARALSDKWLGLDPVIGAVSGMPLLRDALAWIECRTWARHDGGDHLIIIGEIVAYERRLASSGRPLVFSESRYARLDSAKDIETPDQEGQFLHGW